MFPAHAGMIPSKAITCIQRSSVPRACGDDPVLRGLSRLAILCSPRMRG